MRESNLQKRTRHFFDNYVNYNSRKFEISSLSSLYPLLSSSPRFLVTFILQDRIRYLEKARTNISLTRICISSMLITIRSRKFEISLDIHSRRNRNIYSIYVSPSFLSTHPSQFLSLLFISSKLLRHLPS